jgi:hypothetical protein
VSVLGQLEAKIENLVQGIFSRTFKSNVQPVELAHKLAKEMDEHKSVSVSRVYVPNQYSVYLSSEDKEHISGYESALKNELSEYLVDHARDQGLALVARPSVTFKVDSRLRLGEFGIQAQLVRPGAGETDEPAEGEAGKTMIYSPNKAPRAEEPGQFDQPRKRALLVGDGKRTVVSGSKMTIGRGKDCDLVLEDPNVSRRHAEISEQNDGWVVTDLGSTNGIKVNGHRVEQAALEPGDELTLGVSKLSFELE